MVGVKEVLVEVRESRLRVDITFPNSQASYFNVYQTFGVY